MGSIDRRGERGNSGLARRDSQRSTAQGSFNAKKRPQRKPLQPGRSLFAWKIGLMSTCSALRRRKAGSTLLRITPSEIHVTNGPKSAGRNA